MISTFSESSAYSRLADAFLAEFNSEPVDQIQWGLRFVHLQLVMDWLATQPDTQYQQKLIDLIICAAPYLEKSSLLQTILVYLPNCIQAAKDDLHQSFKLSLIAYRANFMAGKWKVAKSMVQAAVRLGKNCLPGEQALAYEAFAILQQNSGDFPAALQNFAKAKTLFTKLGDEKSVIDVISQEAAYYIDTDRFAKAEESYAQVEEYEIATSGQPCGHTLSMIGVVSRRLGKYAKATAYLQELARLGIENQNKNDLANALHHLAWVYINQNRLEQALIYGQEAQKLYHEINDPRGVSDADEQLGEIARLQGNLQASEYYLSRVVSVRRTMDNKVGLASAERRLSKTYFRQKRYFAGTRYLISSALLYFRLGMLNSARIKRLLKDL